MIVSQPKAEWPLLRSSMRIGFLTLRIHPLRTILSTLGVVMGVASIVAVLAMGDGVETFARDQVARTTDLQMVVIAPRTMQQLDGVLVPRPNAVSFSPDDVASLRKAIPEAQSIALARSGAAVAQRTPGDARRGITVNSVLSSNALSPVTLESGRALSDADVGGSSPIVLLSASAAAALAPAPPAPIIGSTVLLGGHPFEVIGVTTRRERDRLEALVPYRAAQAILPANERPRMMLVARNVDSVTAMVARIEQWSRRRFGDRWGDDIDVIANTARLAQWSRAMLVFKLLMGAITSISLLVGGIGIMNVLLAAVAERTREIGVRKAVGARKRDIVAQFLSESLAITSVGSAIGLALGFAAALATAAIMRMRTGAPVYAELGLSTASVAVAASVLVGISFGLYPALRAARLSPVDAIRHE